MGFHTIIWGVKYLVIILFKSQVMTKLIMVKVQVRIGFRELEDQAIEQEDWISEVHGFWVHARY